MQRVLLSLVVVGLQVVSSIGLSAVLCVDVFNGGELDHILNPPAKGPEVLEDYLALAKKREELPGVGQKPTFSVPHEDIARSKTWQGEMPPNLLAGLLPEGVAAIDRPLYEANAEGVVKTAAGGIFVSVRANFKFKGQETGTNVGVPSFALVDNVNRSHKSLVREEAKAVFVFLHGGGTKTTGHHVGIQMMNYLNPWGIDVLTLDLPWHGEGSRVSMSDSRDTLEFVRQFIRLYVPKGKKVFIGGHSMGGFYADEYMMLYPKSQDRLVDGIISLSGVPDLAPGGNALDKFNAWIDKEHRDLVDERIEPKERSASANLLKQNKVTPIAGAYIEAAMRKMNWEKAAHQGADYLPTLMIMGEKDALYLGAENIWNDYRANLSNVEWHLVDAGHQIFDHMIKDTDVYETYFLIKSFMERILGEKLTRVDRSGKAHSTDPVLARIVTEWFNRPVFREFVRSNTYYYKIATEKLILLNQRLASLDKVVKDINKIGKNSSLSQEQRDQLVEEILQRNPISAPDNSGRFLSFEEIQKEAKILSDIRSGIYIPDHGPEAQRARNLLNEIDLLKGYVSAARHKKEELRTLLNGPTTSNGKNSAELESLSVSYRRKTKEFYELMENAASPEINKIREKRDQFFERMFEADGVVRELVAKHLDYLDAAGLLYTTDFMAEFPEVIVQAFGRHDSLQKEYQVILKEVEEVEKNEALRGSAGPELHQLAADLFGSNGLEVKMTQATLRLLEIERYHNRLIARQQELRNQYVDEFSDGYYVNESIPYLDILNISTEEWRTNAKQYLKFIESGIIATWDPFWRERPPETAVTLY